MFIWGVGEKFLSSTIESIIIHLLCTLMENSRYRKSSDLRKMICWLVFIRRLLRAFKKWMNTYISSSDNQMSSTKKTQYQSTECSLPFKHDDTTLRNETTTYFCSTKIRCSFCFKIVSEMLIVEKIKINYSLFMTYYFIYYQFKFWRYIIDDYHWRQINNSSETETFTMIERIKI